MPESELVLDTHPTRGYAARTQANASLADLTVAFAVDFHTAGERLTRKCAADNYLALPLDRPALENARQLYRSLRDRESRRLNIAGNGLYTLAAHRWSQAAINAYVHEVLATVHAHLPLTSIRSGGQTGVDTAGLIAGLRLGLPTTGLYPPGYLTRDASGNDHRHSPDVLRADLLAAAGIDAPVSAPPAVPLPRVLNQHRDPIPKGAVYIGRPSPWGNPFPITATQDREAVCDRFEAWLLTQPDLIARAKRELRGKDLVCYCAPCRCHGDTWLRIANSPEEKAGTQTAAAPNHIFGWSRRDGYEVSSKGDQRFSALFARLSDGRTIESHYQCDIKGYDPGGEQWRLGKGKPPLRTISQQALWGAYLALWQQWANDHPVEMAELRQHALSHQGRLSDCFATSPINQAHALVTLLNNANPPAETHLPQRTPRMLS
jgi:hypothetical protein